jgi:hypothetical protein
MFAIVELACLLSHLSSLKCFQSWKLIATHSTG